MPELRVTRSGGVVTATIDRPDVRNALNLPMFVALRTLFEEVSASDHDRVLVLTGAGGAFSAGGDLRPSSPEPAEPAGVLGQVAETALALHRCTVPVLAAVDGVAAGAGAALAFGCDLVLAADTARFALLFVRRGLSLDSGASWLLPRLVGMRKAKELAFYGDWIDATEAERLGLVNRVVPVGELVDEAQAWAERLATQSPTALGHIKRTLDGAFGRSLADALDAETAAQAACAASPEFHAAMETFRRAT